MPTATASPALLRLVRGDLCWSAIHRCYVRFDRWADSYFAVVADRNTLAELPDYVHKQQLKFAR